MRDAGVPRCFETRWVTAFRAVVCMRLSPMDTNLCVVRVMLTFIPLRVVFSFVRCKGSSPYVLFVVGIGFSSPVFPPFYLIFRRYFI